MNTIGAHHYNTSKYLCMSVYVYIYIYIYVVAHTRMVHCCKELTCFVCVCIIYGVAAGAAVSRAEGNQGGHAEGKRAGGGWTKGDREEGDGRGQISGHTAQEDEAAAGAERRSRVAARGNETV